MTFKAGESVKMDLVLMPSSVELPPEIRTRRHWWPWAVAGGAAALAIAGTGFGFGARSAAAERDEARSGPDFDDAQDDAELRASMSTGLFISAGLAAAVAAGGYLLAGE